MKSQLDLHLAVAEDQLRLCGVPFARDLATIRSRVETLGEEFLTLHLPAAGKAFDKAIDQGWMDHNTFVGFKRRGGSDHRPAFLNGLFAKVFDTEGRLLAEVDPHAVRALRQIFNLHSKLNELPTPDKVDAALKAYVETDRDISNVIPSDLKLEFRRMAREMYGPYFSRMEKVLFEDSFLASAKHGPGAVSDPLPVNQKWNNREWSERLSSFFPAHEYLRTGSKDPETDIFLLPPASEHPSRVIALPKTAK